MEWPFAEERGVKPWKCVSIKIRREELLGVSGGSSKVQLLVAPGKTVGRVLNEAVAVIVGPSLSQLASEAYDSVLISDIWRSRLDNK